MSYVDGYVLPVPRTKLAAYRRMAKDAGKVWMKLGALQYVETVADDVKVGKRTSFPRSVKLKRGEVVVFSFIVYRSRGQRDRVNRQAMKVFTTDPKWKKFMDPKNMPFDGKRMFWGGFKPIVEL
jgi:uncharacterized protein YbaA (DUF1428 family)